MHVEHFKLPTQPPGKMPDRLSHPRLVCNVNELCDRLAHATPGTMIPYHIGLLAADRAPNSLTLTKVQRTALNALADRMMQLSKAGRVHLVQRRIDPERFAYLAIVRPQPSRPPRLVAKAAPSGTALKPTGRKQRAAVSLSPVTDHSEIRHAA
jgi:hypothetical protein